MKLVQLMKLLLLLKVAQGEVAFSCFLYVLYTIYRNILSYMHHMVKGLWTPDN